MPYLIYPPKLAPYILDDEDSQFLHYFSLWGWRYEYHPADDIQIRETAKLAKKTNRPSLYQIWEKECRRRIHEEEKHNAAETKALKDAEKQSKKELIGKQGLRKKVSRFFGKNRGVEKDKNGYKDGVYVNHLEDLQRKWAEEDGDNGAGCNNA